MLKHPARTGLYTLSLHDALPISTSSVGTYHLNAQSATGADGIICSVNANVDDATAVNSIRWALNRSEEHTSELQSLRHIVCRLLLEKKKTNKKNRKHKHSICIST